MKKKAIVLISGGMDSLVVTALAVRKYDVHALHLNYRHRTEKREKRAFEEICSHYGIRKRLAIDISFLSRIGGSALTDRRIGIPRSGKPQGRTIPVTYVPFRNTHLLSMAVSWAEVIGAERILIGAVEEDGSGYPDCREVYYKAFNELVRTGSKAGGRIRVETPLIHKSKEEIVRLGAELKAPFRLSWSCYASGRLACGVCDSCRLRLRGFSGAGLRDPIRYKGKG